MALVKTSKIGRILCTKLMEDFNLEFLAIKCYVAFLVLDLCRKSKFLDCPYSDAINIYGRSSKFSHLPRTQTRESAPENVLIPITSFRNVIRCI